MKLVLYIGGGWPHNKNLQAIERMCNSMSIEYEISGDYNRIKQNNYDILVSCSIFVNPEDIPESIKIIMGPQFFVFPSGEVVGKRNEKLSKRCVYNILSNWIRDVFLEFTEDFIFPMKEFPFSVDINRFRPNPGVNKEYDCVVYIKRRSKKLVDNIISLINSKQIKYKVFKYGSYDENEYKDALQKSKFMLTIDAHESQGFALEEAMSSGVPLLVMDATSMYDEMDNGVNATYEYLRPKNLKATSVPYWSEECGIKLKDEEGLSEAIDYMVKYHSEFSPRDYIIRTLSDEVCMKRILDYFKL
jgi:hypothetical protein